MAVTVTITKGYRDLGYFDNLNQQSAYPNITATPPVAIPSHNQLTGLQGGQTAEYYHFDATEHNELSVWLGQMAMDSNATQVEDITLYGGVYFNNDGDSSGAHEQRFIYWGDNTYIHEYTEDVLRVVCNDVLVLTMDETTVLASGDLDVAGSIEITGNLYFDGGVAVDTIETTLTDDDTHLPTSGAVYDAIAAVGSSYWDRSSAGLITTATAGDDIELDVGAILYVDDIRETPNSASGDLNLQNGAVKIDSSTVNAIMYINGTNSSRLWLEDVGAKVVHLDNGYYNGSYSSLRVGASGAADVDVAHFIFATGEIVVVTGVSPDSNYGAYLGTSSLYYSDLYVDEIHLLGAGGSTESVISADSSDNIIINIGGENIELDGYFVLTNVTEPPDSGLPSSKGYLYMDSADDKLYFKNSATTYDLTDAGVQISGTPVNDQIAVWTNATTIEGDSGLTWSGTVLDTTGTIQVDAIDEHTGTAGVTIDSLLIKDNNIGESTDYQGVAYLTSFSLRSEATNVSMYMYLYSDTAGHSNQRYNYRYGGSVATPAAAPTSAYVFHERGYVYDGGTAREIARFSMQVDGAVASDDVAGRYLWYLRPSGVAASLAIYMMLDETGLNIDNISEYTSSAGVTIESTKFEDDVIEFPYDDSTYFNNRVYNNTSSDRHYYSVYRYGGSEAVPAAAPTSAGILYVRGIINDGSSNLEAARIEMAGTGAVATGSVSAQIRFYTRETTGALTERVRISEAGVLSVNTINEYTASAGVTIESLKIEDAVIDFTDSNTQIWEDGSSNLTFKDAITGTKTLAELAAGVAGYWDRSSAGVITPNTSGDDLYLDASSQFSMIDSVGSTAMVMYPDASDNLYINAGTGIIYFDRASVTNNLHVVDNVQGATYYSEVTGALIQVVVNSAVAAKMSSSGVETDTIAALGTEVTLENWQFTTSDYVIIPEITAPGGTPGATEGYLYMDSADDKLYFKNNSTTYDLTGGAGYFDRSSAGVLSPTTSGDEIAIDTINEDIVDAGVTIEGVKIEDSTLVTAAANLTFTDATTGPHNLSDLIGAKISGTPVNNQVAVWTAADTIEGDANLTWTGAALVVSGNIGTSSGYVTTTYTRSMLMLNSGGTNYTNIYTDTSDNLHIDTGGTTTKVEIHGDLELSSSGDAVNFNDANVQIYRDASTQALSFKDALTGTKTLAELAAGSVEVSGTPVNDQIAVWTNATTIEGALYVTYSAGVLTTRGIVPEATTQYNLGTSSVYWTRLYTNYVNFIDTSTYIWRDGSNNLYFTDSVTGSKTLAELVAGTPAGSNTHIQFNDGGSAFGGSANLVWNDTDLRVTNTEASGVWTEYPTALPNYNVALLRDPASPAVSDYCGLLLNAKPHASYNAYAYLGVQALSASNNTSRFHLMLRGSASTDYETVFSADYDSTYYWKVSSTSADVTHEIQQNSNTIVVFGYDDSGAGFQIETGGSFTTTPGIFIGSTNHNVCIGGQTDSSAYELLVLGATATVCIEATTSDAELEILGNGDTDDAIITLGNLGQSAGTYTSIWYDGGTNLFQISLSGYIGIQIDNVGRLFAPNLANTSSSNYCHYITGTKEITYYTTSDMRLKENIKPWQPDSLSFLRQQELIRYDHKDKSSMNVIGWNGNQMRELMPDLTWLDEKNYVNVKDAHFPYHFHRAIQQLGELTETQEDKIQRLEQRVEELEAQILT